MKKYISFLLAFFMLLCLPVTARAEQQEGTLYWYETGSMTIVVEWDVEQPSITFTDPNGLVYNPAVQQEGTNAAVMNGVLYYNIEAPAAGAWKYSYEKGKNTTVEVWVQADAEPLEIETFTIGTVADNSLSASFRVSGPENQYVRYTISAVAGETGEKELENGSCTTGEDVSVTVGLQNLSSYTDYKLKLYVYYMFNGAEIFDSSVSDSFAYTNPNANNEAPTFSVKIRPDEYLLYVSWEDVSWSVDEILVAVFEDGNDPSYDTYDKYTDGLELSYAPSTKVVAVEMSAKVNGISTDPVRKTMNVADMALACPTGEAYNSVNYPITYKGMTGQQVDLVVNEKNETHQLTGDGTLSITLQDSWNQLSLVYTDSQDVQWELSRKVFVDRIAPVLNMSQNYDGMAVEGNKITIGGVVVDGKKVTVNGEEVEISADGLFGKEVTLEAGENTITVSATDALGNEARYTATVHSGEKAANSTQQEQQKQGDVPGTFLEKLVSPGGFWALLASGVVALLAIGYGLIFWRKEKKDEEV